MGLGGISIWQLAIILVIVLLLFGTKKLRGLGGDLGGAIKGFKKAMTEDKSDGTTEEGQDDADKVENQSTAKTENVKEKSSEKTNAK